MVALSSAESVRPAVTSVALTTVEVTELSSDVDVPSCTAILQHDIDLGDSPPIKHHAYRVNSDKHHCFNREVEYILEHRIAEPSSSLWSSLCLLVF